MNQLVDWLPKHEVNNSWKSAFSDIEMLKSDTGLEKEEIDIPMQYSKQWKPL